MLDTQEKVLYEEADIKNRDSKAYARFKAPAYGGLYGNCTGITRNDRKSDE